MDEAINNMMQHVLQVANEMKQQHNCCIRGPLPGTSRIVWNESELREDARRGSPGYVDFAGSLIRCGISAVDDIHIDSSHAWDLVKVLMPLPMHLPR